MVIIESLPHIEESAWPFPLHVKFYCVVLKYTHGYINRQVGKFQSHAVTAIRHARPARYSNIQSINELTDGETIASAYVSKIL